MSEEGGLTNTQLTVLDKFRRRIMKERFINNQASVYYTKQNSKFVIPGILITGVASVASFMATSDILNDDSKKGFSVGVGIMTAGATILQSISSSFGFQSRSEQFQKAADSYDTLLTKIEFELANPNEDFNEFCSNIEQDILAIKNDCKYLPPLFIHKLWEQHKAHEASKGSDGDSFSHLLPSNISVPAIINDMTSNNVSRAIETVKDLTSVDVDDVANVADNVVKSTVNETTALFEDAEEKRVESDYRSINFVKGMTTSVSTDNIGTSSDPEHIV